jgi:hypothetical protein
MLPGLSNRLLNAIERFTGVRGAPAEHISAPQASAIRVLEEPHAHGAARRIVQVRFPINLEKHFLCDVFGLAFIPENVDRHAVDQSSVSTEQGPQRVAVGRVHFSNQVGVRLLTAGGSALASMDMASHRSDP